METFPAWLALSAGNSPVPVNSPHKGQWRGALMFSLICVWINGWVNNREAGDLRRHHGHYDVIIMNSNITYITQNCTCPSMADSHWLALGKETKWALQVPRDVVRSWWRHQLETFSALLAICVGNSSVSGEFPAQRPVTRSFDVFFDLRLSERLSKHWGWWLETPSLPLWRHSNVLSANVVWSTKTYSQAKTLKNHMYRQVSNIRRTIEGYKIVDHSDVVGASPVGAAPTTSSLST